MKIPKIAIIQPGDFLDARDRMAAGEPEPYFNMRASIAALNELCAGLDHMIVSLNAPVGTVRDGKGLYINVPPPRAPKFVPKRLIEKYRARIIVAHLKRFRPSHVLLRTGAVLGLSVARFCIAHQIEMNVVLANSVADSNPYTSRVNRKLVQLLNDPQVYQVGNYKSVATQSLLDYGLDPEKAVAYGPEGERHPGSYSAKILQPKERFTVCFAGRMTVEKGCLEVIDATRKLLDDGYSVQTMMIGDGPVFETAKARAKGIGDGSIQFTGWVSNDTMFETLRRSDLVVVPTRHEFAEGLPMSLTEALAARSPVVMSDHPIFRASFQEGEGVRFFKARDADNLAEVLGQIFSDEEEYKRLSLMTLKGFERVSSELSMTDLFRAWRNVIV